MILTFLISFHAAAWKLLVIQSVDDSGKTFVTRTEGEMDQMPGWEGTFISQHASIVAKTVEVGEFFTRWQVKDPQSVAPFSEGQTVTFSPSSEAIWRKLSRASTPPSPQEVLTPSDAALEALFKSGELFRPDPSDPQLEEGLRLRLYQGLGLAESISGVPSAVEGSRSQFQGEVSYFWEKWDRVSFDMGFRTDREVNEIKTLVITATRQYLMGGISFDLDQMLPWELALPYIRVAMGVGPSQTQIGDSRQEGLSLILPQVSGGANIPLSRQWRLGIEGGLESVFLRERAGQGVRQRTTQINGKLGVGLRYTF